MQEATVKRLSALQKNRCAYACRKRVGIEACGERERFGGNAAVFSW